MKENGRPSARHALAKVAAGVSILVLSASAAAMNMSFLRDAPITRLSEAELKDFRAFVLKTLDESKDGASAEWTAPKTAFTSKITPAARTKDGGKECREARFESAARELQSSGVYTFCRDGKGVWTIRSPARAKTAKESGK